MDRFSSINYKEINRKIKKMSKDITNYIKTECGLSEYYLLKARKGFFNKLRFYWFVAIATLRDLPKKKPEFKDN